jgi:hypothetical protein
MEEIWSRSWMVRLNDSLRETWFLLPLSQCTFPAPGRYQFTVSLDGELLGQTVCKILSL